MLLTVGTAIVSLLCFLQYATNKGSLFCFGLLSPWSNSYVSEAVLIETFIDSLSTHYAESFKEAFAQLREDPERRSFSEELSTTKLVAVCSRFGSRQCLTPKKFKQMLLQIASYDFFRKPAAAIAAIHQGMHFSFWKQRIVAGALSVYKACLKIRKEKLLVKKVSWATLGNLLVVCLQKIFDLF